MRKTVPIVLLTLAGCAAVAGFVFRPDKAVRVVTGMVSHTLCSETFVAGLDPDQTFSETFRAMPGVRRLVPLLRYGVDRDRRSATATLGGMFGSRAVFRDGFGCELDYGAAGGRATAAAAPSKADEPRAALPDIAGPVVVDTTDEKLRAALDHAFAEPKDGPPRQTKAVVIVHDGHVVAERYAPGYGIDTPLWGWSASKSVINALTGILVRQGRLALGEPAPVPAWQDASDKRRAITVEELLRMTSGLALDETNSGFDPSSRMLYTEPDMAGFAERAPLEAAPGTRWHYSSPTTLILSRIIRDKVGGRAEDVLAFARHELFEPLGMRHVTIEFDATGTPVGSTDIYATARDWARFGLLYLDDGIAGGQRILPEGWASFSASPTPSGRNGYGAGFWTNRGDSFGATYRIEHGWPRDAFFAKGTIGQYVIVIPSERLVIVRFGVTPNWPLNADGVSDLVRDVVAAIHENGRVAAGN